MRRLIIKLGRVLTTLLVTLFSTIASVVITVLTLFLFDHSLNTVILSISIIAPVIITPFCVWYIIDLIIKVHYLEEEQRAHATFDVLTNVFTRRAFFTKFDSVYDLAERNKLPLTLVYIDVDNFKYINDTFGHSAGDTVLKSLGKEIANFLRKSDFVGRIGGEEFAIALPDTDINNAVKMLEKIRVLIKEISFTFKASKSTHCTVSIGVTTYDESNRVGQEQLMVQADDALYKAKSSGRDCVISMS